MPTPLAPHPPAARPRRPGRSRRGRLRLRDHHRRHRARSRPLHPEVRHLPRDGPGGDDGRSRPQPRRRFRLRARNRPGQRHDRRDRQGAGREPAARATATRRSRCRPTSSPARTSTTSPPTSASTPACPARRRRKCPAAPAPRSSPTTAAAAATRWPPPNPAASPAPTSTKSSPARAPAKIEEDIVDPNKVIAEGYPPNVMPENYEQTLSPKELEDLVEYLFDETSGGKAPKPPVRAKAEAGRPPAACDHSRRCGNASSAPRDLPPSLRPGDRGRARRAGADRPHRRRRAAHRLRPRLPGLAAMLRRHHPAAGNARGDRVRQPAADRLRRPRRDRRQRPRLLPPPLPLAPGRCSAPCCRSA